jgi:hypothetical protein
MIAWYKGRAGFTGMLTRTDFLLGFFGASNAAFRPACHLF